MTSKPTAYGAYDVRPNNVFKPDEPLHTCAEPVGYLWKTVAPGTYQFGLNVDFPIMVPDGKVLAARRIFFSTRS